jgi:hypothetical protein
VTRKCVHPFPWPPAGYYQGYVLAEMAVHQNRAHFRAQYGRIVDEPRVGRDLADAYWVRAVAAACLASTNC